MRLMVTLLMASALLAAPGCDINNSSDNPDHVAQLDMSDATQDDTSAPEDQSEVEIKPDFGFDIRTPKQDYSIQCDGVDFSGNPVIFEGPDADWLCTYQYSGESGYVYLQATPVSCTVAMSAVPDYAVKAWFSSGAEPIELEAPGYDFGGNHRNNMFWFIYKNKKISYDHSSYGFGWRICQPMDCLRVAESSGQPILEDGCTMDRTLPIVCVPIKADGTNDPLVDRFKPCNGDPNYPD